MLIHIDLYARLAAVEVEKCLSAMLSENVFVSQYKLPKDSTHGHHLWISFTVVAIKELEHVLLEAFAILVNGSSSFLASFHGFYFLG